MRRPERREAQEAQEAQVRRPERQNSQAWKPVALSVAGTQLVDEEGNPVRLRGISTHGLAWYPQYVNEACFRQIKEEWGMDVVRLAMYTAESGGYCTDGNQDDVKALVQEGVEYATDCGLYVIIDWHILSDGNPNSVPGEESQASDNLTVESRVVNAWEQNNESYYQYEVTITNSADTVREGWKITLTFEGDIALQDSWNGNCQAEGDTLIITNMDYNSRLDAGCSVENIGFILKIVP